MFKNESKQNLTRLEQLINDFIKENSLKNKWVSQKDIRMYLINNNYVEDIALRTIRKCINNVRNFDKTENIIVTDYHNGYKMISSEEERDLIIKEKIKVLKMLETCNKNIKRYNQHNHYKINYSDSELEIVNSLLSV